MRIELTSTARSSTQLSHPRPSCRASVHVSLSESRTGYRGRLFKQRTSFRSRSGGDGECIGAPCSAFSTNCSQSIQTSWVTRKRRGDMVTWRQGDKAACKAAPWEGIDKPQAGGIPSASEPCRADFGHVEPFLSLVRCFLSPGSLDAGIKADIRPMRSDAA
ncbi:hypothetical protein AOQ84DRAFT_222881 [Glonium stellatum]|uniref:Uncharacterized protein n=1 Tax=Glonium stellatum TaxID=574774 RepID=A0A8E2FBW4_9PEZI|nr:hypothetical protein AOQ84DRAFT_222881 [Glonium stellatum]